MSEVKENFLTKYFLTLIIGVNFLFSSYSMTNGFESNVFSHFSLTILITIFTFILESASNNRLGIRGKAFKLTPVVILYSVSALMLFAIFVYI